MPAALALEILHNFTLVHDDIMDRAETRRGGQSVYKKWNSSIALLTGDLMLADAFKKLAYYAQNNAYSKAELADLQATFLKTTVTVCEGQALDMEFVERATVSEDEYLKMIGGKTAALLSGALEMGAITAHESLPNRKKLAELGHKIGIAFQKQDDLLDAIGDPQKFGKRPGGDIFEGKKTYLTILALNRANKAQAAFIQQVLQTQNPDEQAIDKVLEIVMETGIPDVIATEVQNHYNEAFKLLDEFNPSPYKQELEKLIYFLRNRDY